MIRTQESLRIQELEAEVSRLRELADKDTLTGCLRREAFFALIEGRRNFGLLPKKMSLVIADIDFFKKINDKHGHLSGDEVLKEFAARLRDNLPEGALLCRMGGEEFVMIFPLGLSESMQAVETLRGAVADEAFKISSSWLKINVTASFGVAEWDSDAKLLVAAAEADKALYAAKNAGRNCCKVAA